MTEPSEAVASFTFAQIPDVVLYSDVSDKAIRLFAILHKHSTLPDGAVPGRKRIADMLRVKSLDAVDRATNELVAAGFVRKYPRWRMPDGTQAVQDERPHPQAVQTSNRYVLMPQGVAANAGLPWPLTTGGGSRKRAALDQNDPKEIQSDPLPARAEEISAEPPALPAVRDLFAAAFNERRGSVTQRRKMERLCRAGVTLDDFKCAIDITTQQPRDDGFTYALTVAKGVRDDRLNGNPTAGAREHRGARRDGARGNGPSGATGYSRGDGRRGGVAVAVPQRESDRLSPEQVARWTAGGPAAEAGGP